MRRAVSSASAGVRRMNSRDMEDGCWAAGHVIVIRRMTAAGRAGGR